MNPTPESIEQRLEAIETALANVRDEQAQLLQVFDDTNKRYRIEVDEYSSEREERRLSLKVGSILRIAAIALLAYIAYKVT